MRRFYNVNITFLIGNGFDLNLGFRTRYIDFLNNHYLSQAILYDSRIIKFKDMLSVSKESWADAELEFGKITRDFADESSFLLCHANFCHELSKYLREETSGMDSLIKEDLAESFKTAISTFHYNVQNYYTQKIGNLCDWSSDPLNFFFINFNYTHVFDMYIDCLSKGVQPFTDIRLGDSLVPAFIRDNIHVHGTIERDMILGVNDESQVYNIQFSKNRKFRIPFIKPVANQRLHNLKTEQSAQYISDSDVICIFGMSLGETDRIWWEKIGDWLLEDADHLLVIFEYIDNFNPILPTESISMEEGVQDKFFAYNEKFKKMSESAKDNVREQISVAINTDMFANLRGDTQFILKRPSPDLTAADV